MADLRVVYRQKISADLERAQAKLVVLKNQVKSSENGVFFKPVKRVRELEQRIEIMKDRLDKIDDSGTGWEQHRFSIECAWCAMKAAEQELVS